MPARTGARPGPSSVSLQAAWAPGLGSGPEERRVLTQGPIRPWEGGRTDGWEPGGPGEQAREGRQGLGPGCQHGMEATWPGTGQGGGKECQWPWLLWVGESGEQMPLHSPEAKLRRRPGALLGSLGVGEHGPFSGGPSLGLLLLQARCGPVLKGHTDPGSSLGSVLSVGRCQEEGSQPTCCWGAPAEEGTCSSLGKF